MIPEITIDGRSSGAASAAPRDTGSIRNAGCQSAAAVSHRPQALQEVIRALLAEDADDRRDENAGTAGTANVGGITRAVYSDGESDEDLLEDETAPTLAERHARPESD